ncbi:MAG: adenylyl-sulfate kinase, partial [Acidobacteria bacterium]|nr:adenylyl-sulfate kinase [Acidobacteriota bacterium]
VAVNKLDTLDFDSQVFGQVVAELERTIDRLDFSEVSYVPISALEGDNVTVRSARADWYSGRTVLDEIRNWRATFRAPGRSRLGVQLVLRADNFRGLSGTVSGGGFSIGDEVIVLPGERKARLSRLVTFDGDLRHAGNGRAVTMVLEPEVDVTRGDYIEKMIDYTRPADRFSARLVWLDDEPLIVGRSCYLTSGSTTLPTTVASINQRVNVGTGELETASSLTMNEIGFVEIETNAAIPLMEYDVDRNGGNFILIDRVTSNTIGAGMVVRAFRQATNVTKQSYVIDKSVRSSQKGHRSRVIWLTGLSGAGKSTIADALEKRLFAAGLHSFTLDGDNLRLGLNRDLSFTRDDRAENVRRVAEVARLMVDAG